MNHISKLDGTVDTKIDRRQKYVDMLNSTIDHAHKQINRLSKQIDDAENVYNEAIKDRISSYANELEDFMRCAEKDTEQTSDVEDDEPNIKEIPCWALKLKLVEMDEEQFQERFTLNFDEILEINTFIKFPESILKHGNSKIDNISIWLLLFNRFTSMEPDEEIATFCGIDITEFHYFMSNALSYIYLKFHAKMFLDKKFTSNSNFESYNRVIKRNFKDINRHNGVGFLTTFSHRIFDVGTASQPGPNSLLNEYKYQEIIVPTGTSLHLSDAYPANVSDSFLLSNTRLEESLLMVYLNPEYRDQFTIYTSNNLSPDSSTENLIHDTSLYSRRKVFDSLKMNNEAVEEIRNIFVSYDKLLTSFGQVNINIRKDIKEFEQIINSREDTLSTNSLDGSAKTDERDPKRQKVDSDISLTTILTTINNLQTLTTFPYILICWKSSPLNKFNGTKYFIANFFMNLKNCFSSNVVSRAFRTKKPKLSEYLQDIHPLPNKTFLNANEELVVILGEYEGTLDRAGDSYVTDKNLSYRITIDFKSKYPRVRLTS